MPKRDSLVYWTPAVVAALAGVSVFQGHILSRFLYAAAFGFMLQIFSLLAYITVLHLVTRLAGNNSAIRIPERGDLQLTTGLLLVAVVYGLGLYWKEAQSRRILRCAGDASTMTAIGPDATATDFVRYCIEEYDRESSDDWSE